MSLKAKIEAVIYTAEEPVTLAQLTGLLGEEAQAELDAQATAQAEQTPLALEDPEDAALEDADPEKSADAESPEADAAAAANPDAEKKAAKLRERKLRDYFQQLVAELIAEYTSSDRGLEIREVAGGYRFSTKPEYHDAVRGFVKQLKPPLKLSLQALETLAVVAYKQPVTAPEVSEIRGVDSGGVLGGLMARKLVATAGRKQVIGRPILYKTTKDFLVRFGLKDINELPSIEEFEKMAGELGDLLDDGPAQEEIAMYDAAADDSPADHDVSSEAPDDASDAAQSVAPEPEATVEESAAVEQSSEEHEPQADGTP